MGSDPRAAIRARGLELGFDEIAFARAELPEAAGERYRHAIALGRHGGMEWLAREPARRASPRGMWPTARSAIVCTVNYGPDGDPLATLAERSRATISVYARNRDYHELLKGRLKQLAGWIHGRLAAEVKVFVDTAPLLEKPLAQAAGLGWQGKHTNLVSRRFGSWLFLGEILTDLDIEPDAAEADHCGQCRRCLDACPTGAFPAPYQLDARRCISYLTIEHPGSIPLEFREAIGNRIYGCDDCLAVCPWNKFAQASREAKLQARPDLEAPALAELAALDDAAFRLKFSGSPIKRIGRDRFVRNVLVAIGNSGDPALVPAAQRLLADPSPLVREMAAWALGRLSGAAGIAGGGGGMTAGTLFCFGYGYSAGVLAHRLRGLGWKIRGTTRHAEKLEALRSRGVTPFVFDRGRPLPAAAFAGVTHVLTSIPPDEAGDVGLDMHGHELAALPGLAWVGYLGTTAVYGNHDGRWVDETTPLEPTLARADRRAKAEAAWLDSGLPVHIFRLAGIYGPGRNALVNLKAGTARRIVKPGQVFSRIHVEDIAHSIAASMARPDPGRVYNVCDDEPSPPQDVIAFAAGLLGIEPPPELAYETAELPPMARTFYRDNRRVRNDRIKAELGVKLAYPTYREGLRALLAVDG